MQFLRHEADLQRLQPLRKMRVMAHVTEERARLSWPIEAMRNHHDTEDVVQEGFCRLTKSGKRFANLHQALA